MPEQRKPTVTPDDWNRRYETGDTPWDSGIVSAELRKLIESDDVAPSTVIELGCGSGTNAVYLAQRGFTVTAVDLSSKALETAEAKARAAGVKLDPVCGDVTKLAAMKPEPSGPFDFVFDRGCYHGVRRQGLLAGYLATLERVTKPGSKILVLAGNTDAGTEEGPPKVRASDITADFESLCRIERLHAFHFDDGHAGLNPLGWSCLLTRR